MARGAFANFLGFQTDQHKDKNRIFNSVRCPSLRMQNMVDGKDNAAKDSDILPHMPEAHLQHQIA
jgi:hypothetical protein